MPNRKRQRVNKESKPEKARRFNSTINVVPKTRGQEDYIDAIREEDITICNGKAGTGKSLLAVGMALKMIKEQPNRYRRIVMIRPAVTVKGEDLGFLPGGLDDKMMPFMLPMLDGLKFFLQNSDYITMMENGTIEICPVAHIRGRTFNNCIMIFDEAQNSTKAQMKTVITRIGYNTKLIIEGDVTQSDLVGDDGYNNGLRDAMNRFDGVEGVGVCHLQDRDIVRSPILARLLRTYEE